MSAKKRTKEARDQLTYKQRLFVEAYLGPANGNATEAARIAGFACPNKVAHRLVGKSGIQAAIAARLDSAALTTNEILARLSDMASADLLSFLTFAADGTATIDLRRAARDGKGHLLRSIRQSDHGWIITLEPRLPALLKLGEYAQLWEHAQDGPPVTLVSIAERIRQRSKELNGTKDPKP